ncbi:efflux RND transporter permease subunit [Aureliella helgolandensis]|uniref:MMPL family protein n=1 Tax=Aureliella helgolandensis TaxID=2527968 RepID=A0A518G284_9BACT|nr:MMPL family transporter [Aureliella helgolandensis]QDV22694.1 MMPL family protein [Aureliella helgolandensis]
MAECFSNRTRLRVFATFVLLAPLIVYAADLAVKSNSNNVMDWLPESFQETQDLKWFGEHFGTDAMLMLSWEGCTLDDPRARALAEALRRPFIDATDEEIQLFSRVSSGGEIEEQLRGPPLELSAGAARKRLEGWLLEPGGPTTCLVATLADQGWSSRHLLRQHVEDCAGQIPGLAGVKIHQAGSVLDSVEIDRASNDQLLPLALVSFGCCFLLMWWLLGSLKLAGMVFVCALFCQQLSLAMVYVSGTRMDSVLLMIPMLIFVLSISSGVHIANYYRESVHEAGAPGATLRAMEDALVPFWLAAATTAMGLLSLLVSQLAPVQKFGRFSSMAVLLASVVLFSLLPALFEQFSPRIRSSTGNRNRRGPDSGRSSIWPAFLGGVSHAKYLILLVSLGITAHAATGVETLRAGLQIRDMFAPDARIRQDYAWLEEKIGPLVPIELVVRIPKDPAGEVEQPLLERLQLVSQVQRACRSTVGIDAVVSAINFCPSLNGITGQGTANLVRRAVFNKRSEEAMEGLRTSGMLADTPSEQLWRVSGRAYASQENDYAAILEQLRRNVQPLITEVTQAGFPGLSILYCGGVPLVQKAQDQMIRDLGNSFLTAFLLIAVVMASLMVWMSRADWWGQSIRIGLLTVVRNFGAGLLAMVPNVIPCILVLGTMGLLGLRIEIGSMMTASVALGIAVDDTLHFLTWFRRGLQSAKVRKGPAARHHAVLLALQKCGGAMTQTSIICGVGLLAYAMSDFVPIARFSWVMSAMLASALLADLIVLPALLLSPLGALFEPVQEEPLRLALVSPKVDETCLENSPPSKS